MKQNVYKSRVHDDPLSIEGISGGQAMHDFVRPLRDTRPGAPSLAPGSVASGASTLVWGAIPAPIEAPAPACGSAPEPPASGGTAGHRIERLTRFTCDAAGNWFEVPYLRIAAADGRVTRTDFDHHRMVKEARHG